VTHDGLPVLADALRLHYNENTAGCSPVVHAALQQMSREDIGRYPEVDDVTARVERWFDVGRGSVLITNGLDEGLQIVAQYAVWHHSAPGGRSAEPSAREVVLVEPAFEVYEVCADAVGGRIVRIPPEPEFRFPLDRILSAITPATRVIYLTDPNNPTGIGIPSGAIASIAAATPSALVLVDEAYADFSGRSSIGPLLDRQPNVVVGRTFAKAHGLAALRIGALVAHPNTIERLRPMQLPFSVNICAITALTVALDDRAYLDWYVAESARSRELIYDFCRRKRLGFWRSDANFVLVSVGPDAGTITDALRMRRILVRDKSASPGCAGCIRITAGVVSDTTAVLSAMEEILATRTR
jgi:histidinol-phosphate aminotransferase